jgi:hypothetical protein
MAFGLKSTCQHQTFVALAAIRSLPAPRTSPGWQTRHQPEGTASADDPLKGRENVERLSECGLTLDLMPFAHLQYFRLPRTGA